MKTCPSCELQKPLKGFAIKKGKSRQSNCRDCHNIYSKEHYKQYRSKYLKKAKRNNKKYRERFFKLINSIKEQTPCNDCKKHFNPWQMDFDHLGVKEYNIGNMTLLSLSKVRKELGNCELVCANCHRDRTYKRMHPSSTTGRLRFV